MDAIIDFREITLDVPPQLPVFLVFQPLKFLDQINLKFGADPHAEFKGNVFVGIGAAISPGGRSEADGVCFFNPFLDAAWR
jgi:hypothetical protein